MKVLFLLANWPLLGFFFFFNLAISVVVRKGLAATAILLKT